ncbi:hypothetical protein [Halosegnis marinus]|uniref:Uncharacterized protein n=1 Tax=Halosegnis marinus TaxID=3034023 RepID=A0ABD5ZNZ4_9EURY|nr:hypothetical protein [Halosegnis sp. DT85]
MDPELRSRLDVAVVAFVLWVVLSLVVAAFAVMAVNPAVGLAALVTVVLALVVAGASYLRTTRTEVEFAVE